MLNIIIGLLGIGIIITIHEFGHYIMARLCGVEVEVFSIGFGSKLLSRRFAGTEFRLSLIPLGGYCRMKGSKELAQALAEKKDHFEPDAGSFYAAQWWKRACILLAGPLLNILTAVFLYFGLYSIGYTIESSPSKIILVDDITPDESPSPAFQAGLQSGDTILSIHNTPIDSFSDIQEIVSRFPEQQLSYTVQRNNTRVSGSLTPREAGGKGLIGVYPWVTVTVTALEENSPAAIAGLKNGDTIVSANGIPIAHSIDFVGELSNIGASLPVEILREGQQYSYEIHMDSEKQLGFRLPTISDIKRSNTVFSALVDGIRATGNFITLTLQGIGMLFSGTPLKEVLAGPGQLIFSIGSIATDTPSGFVFGRFLELIASISVAIAIMNLLPIPVTDGGQLIIPVIEAIRAKPLSVRFLQRYQIFGVAIMLLILVLAIWQDFNFFRGL